MLRFRKTISNLWGLFCVFFLRGSSCIFTLNFKRKIFLKASPAQSQRRDQRYGLTIQLREVTAARPPSSSSFSLRSPPLPCAIPLLFVPFTAPILFRDPEENAMFAAFPPAEQAAGPPSFNSSELSDWLKPCCPAGSWERDPVQCLGIFQALKC